MDKEKWYKKPEMVVALSALLISLVTTIVGIYSASIDRAYARASVWPRLELFKSSGKDIFEFSVKNSGTGPAIVQYAIVEYQSEPIKRWSDITDLPKVTQSHLGTRILASQDVIIPLKYRGEEINKFIDANKHIEIELCYCSIYDECWLTSRNNTPRPIDECKVEPDVKFLQ